jgi:ribulose-5-phosphate 4-epimerase/fuculose-1-phosphate aldolase
LICNDGVIRPDAVEINEEIMRHVKNFIECGRLLGDNGLSIGTGGNISERMQGGILIKSGGSRLCCMKPEDVVFVSAVENNKVYFLGSKKPSSETMMHWYIYEKRKDINAIAHVNAGPVDGKDIFVTPIEIAWGTKELGEDTSRFLADRDVVMIKNHGVIAVGKTLYEATKKIIECADRNKAYIFT